MHGEPGIEQRGDGSSALAAVLLHGRGGAAADMQALARGLGLGTTRAIFPAATGSTWYPQRFMAPLDANEPALSAALAHVEAAVTRLLDEGVPAGRILLGGFSQGACLTAEFLARHPRAYGGALILTGGLIGPPGTRWPTSAALAGVPVYLTTSRVDDWVPPGRVEETAAWLERCGARVTLQIFDRRPHKVSAEELAAAKTLVDGLRLA